MARYFLGTMIQQCWPLAVVLVSTGTMSRVKEHLWETKPINKRDFCSNVLTNSNMTNHWQGEIQQMWTIKEMFFYGTKPMQLTSQIQKLWWLQHLYPTTSDIFVGLTIQQRYLAYPANAPISSQVLWVSNSLDQWPQKVVPTLTWKKINVVKGCTAIGGHMQYHHLYCSQWPGKLRPFLPGATLHTGFSAHEAGNSCRHNTTKGKMTSNYHPLGPWISFAVFSG